MTTHGVTLYGNHCFGNGLSSGRCQAIAWMNSKMSSAKWWLFYSGLNELSDCFGVTSRCCILKIKSPHNWNSRVIIMPEVVRMTTSVDASDDEVGIKTAKTKLESRRLSVFIAPVFFCAVNLYGWCAQKNPSVEIISSCPESIILDWFSESIGRERQPDQVSRFRVC